ncbi:hypothetical protein QE152_g11403 [Popillia japonica]|uniref:Uncharacterized protein n=1 Tax=Popillia japonica TaxID=7064 RepID=A0AAW1LS17_POPJA
MEFVPEEARKKAKEHKTTGEQRTSPAVPKRKRMESTPTQEPGKKMKEGERRRWETHHLYLHWWQIRNGCQEGKNCHTTKSVPVDRRSCRRGNCRGDVRRMGS